MNSFRFRLKLAAFISVIALGLGVGLHAVTTTAVLNPASDLSGKTLVTAEGNRTITGTWSFNVPLRVNSGTTNAPGLVSASDQSTGWQLSAGSIGGSVNGTQRLLLGASGLSIYGQSVVTNAGRLVADSILYPVVIKSANYTLVAGTDLIVSVSGNTTLTLYSCASGVGRWIDIKKTDSAATTVTVAAAGGETIDGTATLSIVAQYSSYTLVCTTTSAWSVI